MKVSKSKNMIYIRAFTKWCEATPEKALEFCNRFLIEGMPNVPKEDRIRKINEQHLKGITYEELLKEVNPSDM